MKCERRKFGMVLVFAVLFATLTFVSVGCASAATHYVNPGESIQAAVDAADPGDTIKVRDGIYTENIDVDKRLTVGSENGSANCIVQAAKPDDHVFEVTADYVNISGFVLQGALGVNKAGICGNELNECNISSNNITNNDHAIWLDFSSNNTISSNNISSNNACGIYIGNSLNNSVTNNYIKGVLPIMLGRSCGNHIADNIIYSLHPSGINLYDRSDNNVVLNNTVYGVWEDLPCTPIRSIWSLNNLYANNTIVGGRWGIVLMYTNGSIVANNSISGIRDESAICLYHANDNTLINNNISSPKVGGITLFGSSSNNTLQSNVISGAERGISLHYLSNNNAIVNNNVSLNSIGIILDDSSENTVYLNNFVENAEQGYDDGNNYWGCSGKGNYWSDCEGIDENGDGTGDTPHTISPTGIDHYPLIESVEVETVSVPEPEPVKPTEPLPPPVEVWSNVTWKNQTMELTDSYSIYKGGSLTLRNVTLIINRDTWQPFFEVKSGGALYIYDSKIFAQGKPIWTEKGATFHMENSELHSAGPWEGDGAIRIGNDEAVIKNSIIDDSFGINVGNCSRSHIIGNKILNSYRGLGSICSTNNVIANNEISDVIRAGIDAHGLINTTIVNNTIKNVWGGAIMLDWASPEIGTYENTIYHNNFINCRSPGYDNGYNNSWDKGPVEGGNYWDDYKEKYPEASEIDQTGILDTPYEIPGHARAKDNYPLMNPYPYYEKQSSTPVRALTQV